MKTGYKTCVFSVDLDPPPTALPSSLLSSSPPLLSSSSSLASGVRGYSHCRRLYQQQSAVTASPCPTYSTATHHPPPIRDMKPTPTVPTSLKARSRAGGISQLPPSFSVTSRARRHATPTQQSTDRRHVSSMPDAVLSELVFLALPSTCVNTLTSTRRNSTINQALNAVKVPGNGQTAH